MADKYIDPFKYGLTSEDIRVLAVLHSPKKKQIEQEIESEVRI